ncbi:MAG: DNA polymerase III subunit delta [Myxococcaceae bacterium]
MSDELEEVLQELDAGGEAPAYLLAGEEFLIRKAADRLLAKLVPGGSADLNLVTMDGASPKEASAELATMPMFGGRKVVYLRDPEFLAPKKGRPDALNRAREAWKANRRKEAARRVLAIASRAGWGVADLDPTASGAPKAAEWEKELGIALAEVDVAFLKDVAAYCAAEGLAAASNDDSVLQDWLNGKPQKGQVLVIAASDLEAKHPLVKAIKDKGAVLEFKSITRIRDFKGQPSAEVKETLGQFATETLAPHKKKLGPGAMEVLVDRVGGNFRLLQSELTKLALYSDGATITKNDVDLLVGHAREDEYFELSDALQKRNFDAAFKYVKDAADQGIHGLQLLGSIAGVVRNMLNNLERVLRFSEGKAPRNYNDFQARVFPKIEAEAKANKTKVPHPYAAFMSVQSAMGYGRQDLLRGLVACAEADLALKLGGDELVMERLLWTLCGKAAAWESQMHVIRREQER